MASHHRHPMPGRHLQIFGVGETADVVSEHSPSFIRLVCHGSPPSVNRQRQPEAGCQGFHGWHDPLQLFALGYFAARRSLHAADIQHVCPVCGKLFGFAEKIVKSPILSRIVERVGRAVQNAHHYGGFRYAHLF